MYIVAKILQIVSMIYFILTVSAATLYRSDGLGIISVCILSILATAALILIKLEDKARLAFTPSRSPVIRQTFQKSFAKPFILLSLYLYSPTVCQGLQISSN